MKWFRAHLRFIGTAAAVCGWFLFATHFCVDVGRAHTEIVPHAPHSETEPHEADPVAHPECPLALWGSPDRGPINSPMEAEVFSGPMAALPVIGAPAEHAVVLLPADAGRARSAPLYLLHATFLI
jgi:hypothetical protein